MPCRKVESNIWVQRTAQSVTAFASAKPAPLWVVAEPWRYANKVSNDVVIEQQV